MFAKIKTGYRVVHAARKHCVNWHRLVLGAVTGSRGTFRSRAGGVISCDAKMLLRQLVRLENVWQYHGDILHVIRFENTSLVIHDYFGRDFRIPLNAEGVSPPSYFIKEYPFNVSGEVVLDVGAYLGDTPLMWLYRGAKEVIAIEPVPEHFEYLKKNVAGLPVVCIQASLATPIPRIPRLIGSVSYGVKEAYETTDFLSTPTVDLTCLVDRYKPTVVKLDCEGCEHYVLEQLSQIPTLGVKKIAVEFHDTKVTRAYESLVILEGKLGRPVFTKKSIKKISAYWLL